MIDVKEFDVCAISRELFRHVVSFRKKDIQVLAFLFTLVSEFENLETEYEFKLDVDKFPRSEVLNETINKMISKDCLVIDGDFYTMTDASVETFDVLLKDQYLDRYNVISIITSLIVLLPPFDLFIEGVRRDFEQHYTNWTETYESYKNMFKQQLDHFTKAGKSASLLSLFSYISSVMQKVEQSEKRENSKNN